VGICGPGSRVTAGLVRGRSSLDTATVKGRLAKLLLVVVLALVPVATAAVGYYFGTLQSSSAAPTSHPVWTDQEIRSLGGSGTAVSVRCSYHLADGTVRVVETVNNAFDAQRAGRTLC
jgi:hypothetical protein